MFSRAKVRDIVDHDGKMLSTSPPQNAQMLLLLSQQGSRAGIQVL